MLYNTPQHRTFATSIHSGGLVLMYGQALADASIYSSIYSPSLHFVAYLEGAGPPCSLIKLGQTRNCPKLCMPGRATISSCTIWG